MKRLFYLLLFLISGLNVFSQTYFDHYSVSDGLSQSTVLTICKDNRGFMWFGTRDGLNRFDGRTFKQYRHDPDNKNTISTDDYIYSIVEDYDKKLWIGTQDGLNYYSPETDSFERIDKKTVKQAGNDKFAILTICVAKDGKVWFGTNNGISYIENAKSRDFKNIYKKDGLADNEVYSIIEDLKGNIWAGTTNGLTRITYDKQTKKYIYQSFKNNKEDPTSISGNYIKTICEDKKGRIWIGTEKNGISMYDATTNIFKRYNTLNSRLTNDIIRKIIFTKDDKMWVGTMVGVNLINLKTDKFEVYKHEFDNDKSLSDNSIKDIYEDDLGSVWIGTNFGGINVTHRNTLVFDVFKHNDFKNSISGNIISSIIQDNNEIWIGTEGTGLDRYNKLTKTFRFYNHNPADPASIGSNTIKSIFKDSEGYVWVGLFERGLERFDPKTQTFKHYRPNPNHPNSLNHGYVSAVAEDQEGNILIGTSNKGLNILDKKTDHFSYITATSPTKKLSSDYIRNILVDSKGNTWIGTVYGLNLLRKNAADFQKFYRGENGLTSNYINCIEEDQFGNIWIGAHKGGLSIYQAKDNKFKNYTIEDGLVSNNVVGINFDNNGNIWVSTDNGLSKLNRKTQSFKNFDVNDGLPSNEFSVNSTFKDSGGNLYFGTYNGLVFFEPNDLTYNAYAPKIAFTNLKLFNKTVEVNGSDGLLKKDVSFAEKIVFKASQNIFSLDFVAFNYINTQRNKYAYKLEGFEKEWNYVDNPTATYTNLPAGTYKLVVKAANNDGVWTKQPAEITIKVLPPLWKTWWAYLIYLAGFVVVWFQINKFLRKQQKLETDLYYEHINSERQKELYQNKLDFFTKISHEIRTPLTLIFAPLEKLIDSTKKDNALNNQLRSIKNNTDRLLRLISELLDFRKIETGNLKLQLSLVDLDGFCSDIYESFKYLASTKHIHFEYEALAKPYARIDKNQMEKVLYNLLTNAIKYTDEGGTVKLRLRTQNNRVLIDVEDNGVGILEQDQENIFSNFYQSKNENGHIVGWGIGLALVKNIVELHHGEISLQSIQRTEETPGFARFTLSLAAVEVDEETLEALENEEHTPYGVVEPEQAVEQVDEQLVLEEKRDKKHSILIVEDNTELRNFLVQSLIDKYHIYEAQDGEEGLESALKNIPDLIISDVTMPNMDGFEFCSKVKTNESTNHIPVIMLTAMASHLHQVDGLQAGANVYITKPFSLQLLELHVNNLLRSADALREKLSRKIMLMPRDIELENPEEKFLQKLVSLVEKYMEDSEFNVSVLVDEIGMSQTALYKKLKALTGMTITDFIKSIRLKRAAQLLKQKKINIAEVAYSVGFNDRKYFSKEFRKQFGKSPTEYMEEEGDS
ncbi:hybrid sensor histidine kinase/response regulator transcription factor [Pseudopedobacter beijingensis]|uniref:histidine kinase n=1 Tax=Pseudopedobacter beijingensis TaxID=1207056 RepID=A0ABW4IEU4_9SPHI